jgi:pyridoxamine 5'-phosphate oxidase
MKSNDISTYRTDYGLGKLERSDLNESPILQLSKWLGQASDAGLKDYNAFCLGTLDADDFPCSRIVLLRECSDQGLTFFTNYTSEKGRNIERNGKVTMNFFWTSLERQVRVWGLAEQVTTHESDVYFASRPRSSQLGAWASLQSQPLTDRRELDLALEAVTERFKDADVPRPAHWGGYKIDPVKFEFWQGRVSRLHDRFVYSKHEHGWAIQRLNP